MADAVQLRSAWMSTAEYDPDSKELEIVLDDGKSYTYSNVPAQIYQGLISAYSAGKYFRANIRDRFPEG